MSTLLRNLLLFVLPITGMLAILWRCWRGRWR